MNSNQLNELNQLKAELEAFHASPSVADTSRQLARMTGLLAGLQQRLDDVDADVKMLDDVDESILTLAEKQVEKILELQERVKRLESLFECTTPFSVRSWQHLKKGKK